METKEFESRATPGKKTGVLAIIEGVRFWAREDAINEDRNIINPAVSVQKLHVHPASILTTWVDSASHVSPRRNHVRASDRGHRIAQAGLGRGELEVLPVGCPRSILTWLPDAKGSRAGGSGQGEAGWSVTTLGHLRLAVYWHVFAAMIESQYIETCFEPHYSSRRSG